jgi:Dual specificity phosphatase, catalytic domain
VFHVWKKQNGRNVRNWDCPPQPALIYCRGGRNGLFIGDADDWFTERTIGENVKTIINLCPDCMSPDDSLEKAVLHDITLIHMPAEDTHDFDIVKKICLEGCCLKMIHDRLAFGSVLVNCYGGCNRSGAVAVAYLNHMVNVPLTEAFALVNNNRGCILTNYAFRLQLAKAAQASGKPL